MRGLALGDSIDGFKLRSLWPQSLSCFHTLSLLPLSTPGAGWGGATRPWCGDWTGLREQVQAQEQNLTVSETRPPPLLTPPASWSLSLSLHKAQPSSCLRQWAPHDMDGKAL